MMKIFLFDLYEDRLEPGDEHELVRRVMKPGGVVLIMTAFARNFPPLWQSLKSSLPAWTGSPIDGRLRGYDRQAPRVLARKLRENWRGAGSETVLGWTDQPWSTLVDGATASEELLEFVHDVEDSGGTFTCAYVTDDVPGQQAVSRYRQWAGACAQVHRMSLAERNAFFCLGDEVETAFSEYEKSHWKQRLGECRAHVSDAVLRTVAASFAHLSRTNDREAWRFLALAVAQDFLEGDNSLENVVADELQLRRAGWGSESFGRGGLGRFCITGRALGLLLSQGKLPSDASATLKNLCSMSGSFSAIAGWESRADSVLKVDICVTDVETTLRRTRNKIEHTEGHSPSPLWFAAVEQVVVALEEYAKDARESMPTTKNRWGLGRENWQEPMACMTNRQAGELAKAAWRFVRERVPYSQLSGRGAHQLVQATRLLAQPDLSALEKNTGWPEWQHLLNLQDLLKRIPEP